MCVVGDVCESPTHWTTGLNGGERDLVHVFREYSPVKVKLLEPPSRPPRVKYRINMASCRLFGALKQFSRTHLHFVTRAGDYFSIENKVTPVRLFRNKNDFEHSLHSRCNLCSSYLYYP